MGGKGKGKGPSKSKVKTEVLEATTPHGDSDATLSSHPNLNLALTPTQPPLGRPSSAFAPLAPTAARRLA